MLCVMGIANSLRLTDKQRVGKEFHKRARGGGFICASGDLKEMREAYLSSDIWVWFLLCRLVIETHSLHKTGSMS